MSSRSPRYSHDLFLLLGVLALLSVLVVGCQFPTSQPIPTPVPPTPTFTPHATPTFTPTMQPTPTPVTSTRTPSIANPASQYCVDHGGTLEIRKSAEGNEVGICVFPNGSECEEWAYYRGQCQPTLQSAKPTRIVFEPGATSASVEGEVTDKAKVTFVVRAMKGQLMMVTLSAPQDDIFLGITTDDGSPLVRPVAEAQHWTGELPRSGDYYIEVVAMRQGAPFSLFVQIPRTITFPEGSNTVTFQGVVRQGQMVDYLLKARQGQHLTVSVDSPNKEALLNIVALENGAPLLRYVAEETTFDEVLPFDDKYLISVFGGGSQVKYTLTVTLSGEKGTSKQTYDDPFAYCQAVGTVDEPDARYVGPEVPPAIIAAIRQAAGIGKDAPDDWVARGTVWRCMDGQVWGCFRGANIPCMARANTDKTPSEGMTKYCQEHPDAEVIPASVTGHETVYEWRCKGQVPEPVRQVWHPDKQGFISEFWYALTP